MPEGRRLTDGRTIHHQFYFTNNSFAPDGRTLYVVAYDEDETPNLFALDLDGPLPSAGERLSARADLNPYSPTADDVGRYLYFSGGRSLWRLSLATRAIVELAHFEGGFPSNCAVSRDGHWLATSVRYPDRCRLVALDLRTGAVQSVVEAARAIGHVQFSAKPPYRILYSGPPEQRLWSVALDGSGDTLLYRQQPGEWVVHESWLGESGTFIFTRWPDALCALDEPGAAPRILAATNAWHACADRAGRRIVFDTVHPDRGLQLLDVATLAVAQLTDSASSSLGRLWRGRTPAPSASTDPSIFRDVIRGEPAPKLDARESDYGPQWTHPHPAFSPDGRSVVYTSDREGVPHVYLVEVPEPIGREGRWVEVEAYVPEQSETGRATA